MGYQMDKEAADALFAKWARRYDIYAPKRMAGEGTFTDIDVVRYGKINSITEIEWKRKSDYSFKEVLLPINETLFYFTEDQTTVPNGPAKDYLIFLRACDLHAVKRLDDTYLNSPYSDFYYGRVRERIKFVLMGCETSCENGFCVSMGTNRSEAYDAYIKTDGEQVWAELRLPEMLQDMEDMVTEQTLHNQETIRKVIVEPDYVKENSETVALPRNLSNDTFADPIWQEYGSRCVSCGRCNFVCPTCTCFTMQDIFYRDNANAGERRRVWASCQIDGYSQIAGGHEFRTKQGDRLRFRVLHKIYHYEKRFGYPMCVGCGRCSDVCPEYISYSHCVNRLAEKEQEVL